jgi:hypothetical protein
MALTIPDNDVAYSANPQSLMFQATLQALVAAVQNTGVISGCAVTQRAAGANMSVDVASGRIISGGTQAAVSGGNVAVTAAHATLPRIDMVVSTSAGARAVRAGTAAANPKEPALTAGDVLLAQVYVPANATQITDTAPALIIDRRAFVSAIHALLSGLSGGQTVHGGISSAETLTLRGNANGLNGKVYLGSSAKLELDETSGQLKVPTTGSGAGILIGGDVHWYRDAADLWRTPDNVRVGGYLRVDAYVGIGTLDSTVALSIGGGPYTNVGFQVAATVLSNAFGGYLEYWGNSVLRVDAAGRDVFGLHMAGGSVDTTGSNHNVNSLTEVYLGARSKSGSGTITQAVTLRVGAPTIATNNYHFAFNGVSTAAGGTYYGRIPVLVEGVGTKYIHLSNA